MLGELMDPGGQGENASNSSQGLTPKQLENIEKTFQEWNQSTGGNFPSLDSIPQEWIQEAMQNQELQSRARELLDEYSKTRKLPLNNPQSAPNTSSNKTYDDLLKQFQRQNTTGGRDQNPDPNNELRQPSPQSNTNQRLDRSRLRPAAPLQNPSSPMQSNPNFDRNEDLPERSQLSPDAKPGAASRQQPRDQGQTDPSNRYRNERQQTQTQSRSQPAQPEVRANRPPSTAAPGRLNPQSPGSSNFPNSPAGTSATNTPQGFPSTNPFRDPSEQQLKANDDLTSSPDAISTPSPFSPETNSPQSALRSANRTDERITPPGRTNSSPPPQLNDQMRRQLRELFTQLAEQGALPGGERDSQNSERLSARDSTNGTRSMDQAVRGSRTSPLTQERRQARTNRSSPLPNQSKSRSGSLSSSSNSNKAPTLQPSQQQRLSDLLLNADRATENTTSPNSPLGDNTRDALANRSNTRDAATTSTGAEPLDLEELFSDESLSHLWEQKETPARPSASSSPKSSSGFTPGDMNDLIEAARKVRNSDLGKQIQEQFSKSAKSGGNGSQNSGASSSTPDIKSQVERYGFGRTLQGIVEKTLKDEGLRDGESIFSTRDSSKKNSTNSNSGPQASAKTEQVAKTQPKSRTAKQNNETDLTRNRNRPSQRNREKSTLEQLSDSFWASSKETPEKPRNTTSTNSRSSNAASQSSGTSNWSLEGWSWEMGASQWIVLVGIGLLLLTVWLLRTQFNDQAAALKKEVRWAKEKLRTGMTSRQDVVRAYHSLVLNRTSPASRWWTHRYVERKFSEALPQLQASLRDLTQVYELARYQPPELELRNDQLATVQSALSELEAAGT